MVYGIGLSFDDAVGVSLFGVCFGSLVGVGAQLKVDRDILRPGYIMATASLITAPVGATLCQYLDPHMGMVLYALVLLFSGWVLWMRSQQRQLPAFIFGTPLNLAPHDGHVSFVVRPLVYAGGIGGFLTGLLGVGGGAFLLPALLTYTSLSTANAARASLVVIIGFTFAGLAGHLFQGNGVPMAIALPFAAASVAGLFAGRALQGHIADTSLAAFFSYMRLVVGVVILIREIALYLLRYFA